MKKILLVAAMSLSACSMSTEYISTASGPVECFGFMEEYVYLDRAVSFPDNMSKEDADTACKRYGAQKLLAASE